MTQIEKQQFVNNTGGYIGAVIITARGEDRGIAVEPGGTVWLSEAEQELTANAPRQAKDNPFIPQILQRTNPETGVAEDYEVTPLTPSSEERYVPSSRRPIPGTLSEHHALAASQQAATGDEPEVVVDDRKTVESRTEEVLAGASQPKVPPRAAAAAAAQPPAPEPVSPESPGVRQPEETAKAEEEQATAVEAQPPTEGGYQAGEEVGTPVAPQPPTDDTEKTPGTPPAPWTG
jgi:hypothetical protein